MSAGKYQLADSLLLVPGIGPNTYLKLSKRGLKTVADLLRLYPTRYEDYSQVALCAGLVEDETVTIVGEVIKGKNTYTRKRGFTIQNLLIKDQSGELELTWFNQPYILKNFIHGESYRFSGKVTVFRGQETLAVREFEPLNAPKNHTGKIIPYYSEAYGVSAKLIRQKITYILANLNSGLMEKLSQQILKSLPLLTPLAALLSIHQPQSLAELKAAQDHYRLNELLSIKLRSLKQAEKIKKISCPRLKIIPDSENPFTKNLPFKLTSSQTSVIAEITADFKNQLYFNRLLMGDVGSGKTVIIAYLCYLMGINRQRTFILVPTEALAQQHYQALNEFLGFNKTKIQLLTASEKGERYDRAEVIIGTQAFFFKQNELPQFGLLIVDEQHKFGVRDREKLLEQSSPLPHCLTVSATPIPRSLAQSLYGEVETSYLNDKPFRRTVKTFLVPEAKRAASYQWIEKIIRSQHIQAFVICAAIEGKELPTTAEIRTVKAELVKLTKLFPQLNIGAIYSKHPQKKAILESFRQHKLDILISTSLIEVGIDIPEANLMIIENAERFGLSQLHQMRGRIGRRNEEAHCLLFSESNNPDTLNRLKILEHTDDAFLIAEKDLELRGPGNLLGTEQHGFSFLTLKDLLNDKLNERVNLIAKELLAKQTSMDYTTLVI